MKQVCLLTIGLALLACSKHRDLTEYSLNENSFDSEAMLKIERESGIDLPDGSKGLAFHHIPPIDPIVFAKVVIPADGKDSLAKQLGALKLGGDSFPKDFANDRCKWWPKTPESVVLFKQANNNGTYIELYLLKETEHLVLYIKYFTI